MKVTICILLLAALCSSCVSSEEGTNFFRITRNNVNNRLDFIEKKLRGADLVPGTPLTDEVKNYVKSISAPGDVVGVIFDERLGGLSNETFNALPMNPSAQEIWQTKVLDPLYDWMMANKSKDVMLMLVPFYEDINSKRPYGLAVFVNRINDSNDNLVKGYIPNPLKETAQVVTPHLYSSSRSYNVERKNESFDIIGVGGERPRLERVEIATKVVHLSDLTTGKEVDEFARNYTRKLAGDKPHVPGLLLSQKLGGKGDDPYNVVPMTPKTVEEFKTRVEVPTLSFFSDPAKKDKTATITVIVMYADHLTTFPVGFCIFSSQSSNPSMYVPNE